MALKGVSVLELAGLAPAPFCGMILADFGASVIRIDKYPPGPDVDCLGNGKRSVSLNLKTNEGTNILKTLSKKADVLIEPFRPGVMEKLGLGPKVLTEENNKLIYARMSGFGQSGPWAERAGHDINYVALSGLLSMIGGIGKVPLPPANLAADFAGGGLLCALGIVIALLERSKSGLGQVIDANITDGVAYAGSWILRSKELPIWDGPRGTNVLDGGRHYYFCYETKDSKFMAVGALEPQFYNTFLECLNLDSEEVPQYTDDYEKMKSIIQNIFKQHTQQHWIEVFKDVDACVTPVLNSNEAANWNKNGFKKNTEGFWAPVPAPKLSRTPAVTQSTKPKLIQGEHTIEILKEAGFTKLDIEKFVSNSTISSPSKL